MSCSKGAELIFLSRIISTVNYFGRWLFFFFPSRRLPLVLTSGRRYRLPAAACSEGVTPSLSFRTEFYKAESVFCTIIVIIKQSAIVIIIIITVSRFPGASATLYPFANAIIISAVTPPIFSWPLFRLRHLHPLGDVYLLHFSDSREELHWCCLPCYYRKNKDSIIRGRSKCLTFLFGAGGRAYLFTLMPSLVLIFHLAVFPMRWQDNNTGLLLHTHFFISILIGPLPGSVFVSPGPRLQPFIPCPF